MPANEIEIALWPRGSQAEGYFPSLLQRYHQQTRSARVKVHFMDVKNPWAEVSRTMINKIGADVTELGASWVESLVATNSLRPFSPGEFQSFGGPNAFVIPAWQSQKEDAENLVYSIPHMTDSRHVYYRRDILAQAGVDEHTAFTTPKNLLQTLDRLKRAGIKYPLIAPITTPRMNLSFIASWVWGAGADFIDSTGTRATFDHPEAIAKLAEYFKAAEYIAPEFRQMDITQTDREFSQGNVAITFSGSWLYYIIQQSPELESLRANLGIALPPGHAYCGGTHFVVWKHNIYQEAAFDFISFLTSVQVQSELSGSFFNVPARLEAIQASPYADDPNYQMIVKAVHTGRSYSASKLWNIVEDRLSRVLDQMWPEYFETQGVDASAFLSARLEPLAKRINITLEE